MTGWILWKPLYYYFNVVAFASLFGLGATFMVTSAEVYFIHFISFYSFKCSYFSFLFLFFLFPHNIFSLLSTNCFSIFILTVNILIHFFLKDSNIHVLLYLIFFIKHLSSLSSMQQVSILFPNSFTNFAFAEQTHRGQSFCCKALELLLLRFHCALRT